MEFLESFTQPHEIVVPSRYGPALTRSVDSIDDISLLEHSSLNFFVFWDFDLNIEIEQFAQLWSLTGNRSRKYLLFRLFVDIVVFVGFCDELGFHLFIRLFLFSVCWSRWCLFWFWSRFLLFWFWLSLSWLCLTFESWLFFLFLDGNPLAERNSLLISRLIGFCCFANWLFLNWLGSFWCFSLFLCLRNYFFGRLGFCLPALFLSFKFLDDLAIMKYIPFGDLSYSTFRCLTLPPDFYFQAKAEMLQHRVQLR